MSEIQDTINQILSNPEAMRQVQSLGEQLGLSNNPPAPLPAPAVPAVPVQQDNGEMISALTKLAPLMSKAAPNDETTALLNALRPFLSGEKLNRLNHAQKLMRLIKIIPLIKDSGLFF